MEYGFFTRCYLGMVQLGRLLAPFLLLAVRLYWGALLVVTGLGKWTHIDQTADFFASIHIPYPTIMAGFVGIVELVGGLALILGLFSRFMSFVLIVLFFVAYATAHTDSLVNIVHNPAGFIAEQPFLFLYASFMVFCFGPGFFSCDYWIEKKIYGDGI